MSALAAAPRRRTWLLHAAGILAVPLCLAAGVFEFGRARGGNALSWGYAVEWPLIAGYVVYIWRKLLREKSDDGLPGRRPARPEVAAGGPAVDDEGLRAWQDYLTALHEHDPPGGPPGRR